MKYVKQIGIILGITLAGECLNQFLPLPVPAGVYGLFLLLGTYGYHEHDVYSRYGGNHRVRGSAADGTASVSSDHRSVHYRCYGSDRKGGSAYGGKERKRTGRTVR